MSPIISVIYNIYEYLMVILKLIMNVFCFFLKKDLSDISRKQIECRRLLAKKYLSLYDTMKSNDVLSLDELKSAHNVYSSIWLATCEKCQQSNLIHAHVWGEYV